MIALIRSGKASQQLLKALDAANTESMRLSERNPAVREKLFDLRMVIDSSLLKSNNFGWRLPPLSSERAAKRAAILQFRL